MKEIADVRASEFGWLVYAKEGKDWPDCSDLPEFPENEALFGIYCYTYD